MTKEEIINRITNNDYDVVVKNGEKHNVCPGTATHYSVGAIFSMSNSNDLWVVKQECICVNTENGLLDIDGSPFDIAKYAELKEHNPK